MEPELRQRLSAQAFVGAKGTAECQTLFKPEIILRLSIDISLLNPATYNQTPQKQPPDPIFPKKAL
jgi:hypothetical protein